MEPRATGSDAARPLERFRAWHRYRAASMPDAPLRTTREEAEADELAYHDERERAQ